MPKYPYEQTLLPEKALSNGLRSNSPAIVKGEDLTALKTLASALTEQYQPSQASEFMWVQVMAYSFFRLHRIWSLSTQVAEREMNSATLFNSLEYDDLRPAIEEFIESIQNDIQSLSALFKNLLDNPKEFPLVGLEHSLIIIASREYLNSSPELQEGIANALKTLKATQLAKDLEDPVEGILRGLRQLIATHRETILEIEKIRDRLSATSITTKAIHKDNDRLLNQEIKLVAQIEKCQNNLAKLKRQVKTEKPA